MHGLGATELIELGATELIEMGGQYGMGQVSRSSPVLQLFRFVDYIEDPVKGIELEPGESFSQKERAIAERLHTASTLSRRALVTRSGLGESLSECAALAAVLDGLENMEISLGKKKKHGISKIASKAVKVVKSPAFLAVVGVAANLIPVVGQVASAGLLMASAAMAKKQEAAKQKKAVKKQERFAAAETVKMEAAQVEEYYRQNQEAFSSMGYTPEVWKTFSFDKKKDVIQKGADGTLQPNLTPEAKSAAAQSAGMSLAMQNVYGSALPGPGIDQSALPPEVQKEAAKAAPEYQRQIEAVGKDNFMATAMKSVGQAGAIDSMLKGVGLELPGGLSELLGGAKSGPAYEAGVQDLKNDAAAVGALDTVSDAIDRGESSGFPWVPVGVGAGALVVIIGIATLTKRGS
jgi:hypothetical protein